MLSLRYSTLLAVLSLCSVAFAAPARPAPTDPCALNIEGTSLRGRAVGESCRFTVRYAQAERWGMSMPINDLSGYDTSNLPNACPQEAGSPVLVNAPGQAEDCLFAIIYVAQTALKADRKLPVFTWIHGGSYLAGSASAPGLDASQLASIGNMVVVVLQYRLGVLGMLPPALGDGAGDPNLALNDVINGLTAVRTHVERLGGDKGQVTIAGQSSGASMVRALLAAPKAKGLFRAAILQSDPMTYGTASVDTTNQLRNLFYAMPKISGCNDLACLRRKPLADILEAQAEFAAGAPAAVQGVPFVTPVRPTHGTSSLPADSHSLVSSYASAPWSIPLLVSTTTHEAGSVTQSIFPFPIPPDNNTYFGLLSMFVGPDRAGQLVQSSEYALGTSGDDVFRQTFERLVTDGVWRCPSRDFGKRWADAGGKVWVGEFTKGVGYVSNEGGSYCQGDRVCHEDDIFPTFHSVPNPSRDQLALEDDIVRRWSTFVHTLDPNLQSPLGSSNIALPPGSVDVSISAPLRPGWEEPGRVVDAHVAVPGPVRRPGVASRADMAGVKKRQTSPGYWAQYRGDAAQVMALGNGRKLDCPRGFWGERVQYDWQLFG